MRFMIIRKADEQTEAGAKPTTELLTAMGNYMEGLAAAGVLLGGDGLKPTNQGKRIKFKKGKPTVIDGPFTETKELIAGYALIDVPSMKEAVDWMKKWPKEDGDVELEIRPLYEADDFGEEFTSDIRRQEELLRQHATRGA